MRRLFLLIAVAQLIVAPLSGAYAQDPGNVDSLAFGNTDGSTIDIFIGDEVSIPVYIKCDENVAFTHLCLATENEYVPTRSGVVTHGPLTDWLVVGTLPVDGWPVEGQTSQSIVAIADFSLPEPNYINTNGQWLQIGEFRLITTDDFDAMGQTTDLYPGEDPVEGVTVLFDEFWTPIVPEMIFSSLHFLEAIPPEITSPSEDTLILVNTLYPFSFDVVAEDEDSGTVVITADCVYDDFQFTMIESSPGYARYQFSWTPPDTCMPVVPVTFEAIDDNNMNDELTVNINAEPVGIHVTSDTTMPGYVAAVDISLVMSGSNSNVGGFNLALVWDPVAFHVADIDFGEDFGGWDYLNATLDPLGPGSLVLVGLANVGQGHVPPMTQGDYQIAHISFEAEDNEGLQGMSFPLDMPIDNLNRNTLSDSSGYLTYHPGLFPGTIYFLDLDDVLIGDINLNLYPYEMGDVITFIDHLIDPQGHPFNVTQHFASDCNQDFICETIADLIFMLNVINGSDTLSTLAENGPAEIALSSRGQAIDVKFSEDSPVGGAYFKINHGDATIDNIGAPSGYELHYQDSNGLLTVVIYAEPAASAIGSDLLTFDVESGNADEVEIEYYEISTTDGRLIQK